MSCHRLPIIIANTLTLKGTCQAHVCVFRLWEELRGTAENARRMVVAVEGEIKNPGRTGRNLAPHTTDLSPDPDVSLLHHLLRCSCKLKQCKKKKKSFFEKHFTKASGSQLEQQFILRRVKVKPQEIKAAQDKDQKMSNKPGTQGGKIGKKRKIKPHK